MADSTLTVRFGVFGGLRFLSHMETYKLFQRAFIRCGLNLAFSEGFNPRPKMSLVLPRPVGVCSDDELLTAELKGHYPQDTGMVKKIGSVLVKGCEIKSAEICEGKAAFAADNAVYRLILNKETGLKVSQRINDLVELKKHGEPFLIERSTEKVRQKKIDLFTFIEKMEMNGNIADITVNICNDGSVRIEEIFEMLEIKVFDLCEPVLRTAVGWRRKGKV